MRKKVLLLTAPFLLLCVFSAGCTTNLGDFTVLTSKNVNLSDFSTSQAEESSEKVVGKHEVHIICFVPTGQPSLKEALDRALESKNAYMLTNARIENFFFYIPYIYGQARFTVEGRPVVRRQPGS